MSSELERYRLPGVGVESVEARVLPYKERRAFGHALTRIEAAKDVEVAKLEAEAFLMRYRVQAYTYGVGRVLDAQANISARERMLCELEPGASARLPSWLRRRPSALEVSSTTSAIGSARDPRTSGRTSARRSSSKRPGFGSRSSQSAIWSTLLAERSPAAD